MFKPPQERFPLSPWADKEQAILCGEDLPDRVGPGKAVLYQDVLDAHRICPAGEKEFEVLTAPHGQREGV
jgi:hypothetical protein